jgi:serine/threonine kinase 17
LFVAGTVDYMAPEVLSYDPICLSTDVWSIGVLSYVLLSGYTPFGADDKQQTFLNISKCDLSFECDLFDGVSKTATEFIRSALVTDPR